MTTPIDTLWFVNPNHPIELALWNDTPHEAIAYHTATGDTHLITREGHIILSILQKDYAKLNAERITEKFRTELNEPEAEFNSADIIEAFLIPFQHLGFIETETP